jgi:hypothetical protein
VRLKISLGTMRARRPARRQSPRFHVRAILRVNWGSRHRAKGDRSQRSSNH